MLIQHPLSSEYLKSYDQMIITLKTIEELNQNIKKFIEKSNFNLDVESCLNNKEFEDHILEDRINGAKKYKIDSTPTLIIMGEKFEKPLTYKNIKKALEKLI